MAKKIASSNDRDRTPPVPTAPEGATRHASSMLESKPFDSLGTPDPDAVSVLCVDDHEILVEGLKAQFAIDGSIRVVGWLPSAERLLAETERLKPDVVLIDIEMPGPDAFETADRIRHLFPRVRVAFLSAHVRDGYIAAAYKCHAAGYFAKGDDLKAIMAGIHEIARRVTKPGTGNEFVMGPKVRERCLVPQHTSPYARAKPRPAADGPPSTPLAALSDREIEILRLIGKGRSRNEIAQELSRSAKTVDGHQERMMRKLNITSRSDLMRFAIREGLAEA